MFGHSLISMTGRLAVWFWRIAAAVHRYFRARRRSQVSPPLLVVGSARAGGACKTDLVDWIAKAHPHLAILCHATGDEDLWLQRRHPGRVFVHRDWLKAWKLAQAAGFSAAVCDGGLQDPALDRCPALRLDVEPIPQSWKDFHPWGPWREDPRNSRPAMGVWVSRDLHPSLHLDEPFRGETRRAACAVARPHVFFADLQSDGVELVERVALRDHARFPRRLVQRMAVKPQEWVVTEKDAARGGLPEGVQVARRRLDPSLPIQERIGRLVGSLNSGHLV